MDFIDCEKVDDPKHYKLIKKEDSKKDYYKFLQGF